MDSNHLMKLLKSSTLISRLMEEKRKKTFITMPIKKNFIEEGHAPDKLSESDLAFSENTDLSKIYGK